MTEWKEIIDSIPKVSRFFFGIAFDNFVRASICLFRLWRTRGK